MGIYKQFVSPNTDVVFTSVSSPNIYVSNNIFGTASWAQNASNAVSSSYALTASYALNGGGGGVELTNFIATGSVTASVNTNPNELFLIKSGSFTHFLISASSETTLYSDLFIIKNYTTQQPVLTISQSVVQFATQSVDPTGTAEAGSIWFTSSSFYVALE